MTESREAAQGHQAQRLRDALARTEGELAIAVQVIGDAVCLTGVVQDEGRRSRIESLCRQLSSGYVLVSQIELCPPAPPLGEPERLA